MLNLSLVMPQSIHISSIQQYKEQFPLNDKGIEGSSELMFAQTIEQWLEQIERNRWKETVKEGRVAADQYIAIDEATQTVVGMLNLRKELNDYLFQYIGHIGYSVAPNRRRQGIGSEMLRLALIEAKKLTLKRVLITCADDNIGSWKVIENNGGILEDKRVDPGDGLLTRRYWINL